MNVRPLREALAIRRYSMLIQLLSNPFPTKIVLSEIEYSFYTIVTTVGYENIGSDTNVDKRNKIVSACLASIKNIREAPGEDERIYDTAIRYLMKHHTKDNHALLRHLVHSKNGLRGIT